MRTKVYRSITVYHREGIGRHGDPDKLSATLEFPFLHSKIVKIEINVADEQQNEVINIIQLPPIIKEMELFPVLTSIRLLASEQVKKAELFFN